MPERKVWFVALVGRPNAGKSTFMNAFLDEKISIVSSTAQTTQRPIRWVYTDEDRQIIFVDVPGFHSSMREWNQRLNDVVVRSLGECDAILRLIDSTRLDGKEEQMIDALLSKIDKPVITVYSKVDMLRTRGDLPKDAIAMSSNTGEGFPEIISWLDAVLPVGPLLYNEDDITDQDIYTRVSEVIREKIFRHYRHEIPHSVYVEIYAFEDTPGLVRIEAMIHCESDSQKKILIGKWWEGLKRVGTHAREDLESIFEKKVYLGLRVKVSRNWRADDVLMGDLF